MLSKRGNGLYVLATLAAAILGWIALGNGLLFGQGFSGAISGVVRDATGAVVPEAAITVRNTETGLTRRAETGVNGGYNAPSLPVGPYELTVEKAGFKQQVRMGINLSVAQEAVVNFTLEVGNVQQTVEVTGEAPIVNTTLSSTSGLITGEQLKGMPLNGRSFDQLLLLNTGTVNNTSNSGWTSFSVAGKRTETNRFTINGVDYVGANSTGQYIAPSGVSRQLLGVEAVREYNVLGHTYGAEYGKRAGAQISIVTSSGTNQLHGAAFEYLRNSALDARNFFDDTEAVPPFKRNQFGGTLGGPIIKDKMFLFGNYEGFRQRLAQSVVVTVPNAQARQGYLPNASGVYVPVPNLVPGMLPYANYFYPAPNGPELLDPVTQLPTGTAQSFGNPMQKVLEDFGLVRYDYTRSSKDSLSSNFTVDKGERAEPPGSGNSVFVSNTTQKSYTLGAQETHVFSPTVLNVAIFGFSRAGGTGVTTTVDPIPANLAFLRGTVDGKERSNPGAITIGGGATTNVAGTIVAANGSNLNFNTRRNYTWADDVRFVKGRHSLSAGVWFQRVQLTTFASTQASAGTISYPTLLTFLQDRPNNFNASPNPTVQNFRSTESAWYFQDEIKLRPNLTVRLGLRDEMTTGWNEKNGRVSNFSFDPNGIILTEPFIGHSAFLENNAIALWQPRVGVAWDPTGTGRWAVRAGFGIHNDLQDNLGHRLKGNPPFDSRMQISGRPLLSIIPIATGTQPPPTCKTLPQTNDCSIFAVAGLDPLMHTPTIQQWSLTVERGITQDLMVELGYVGSESYHISTTMSKNVAHPQVCADPAGCLSGGNRGRSQAVIVPQGTTYMPWTGQRPNPFVGSTQGWYYLGTSSYQSGSVSLVKRSRGGLTFKTNYTFAKVMDINSAILISSADNEPPTIMNPFDLKSSRGVGSYSLKHQFNTNFSYPLPFGQGKAFGSGASGWVEKLIGGWQWNGILTAQSGFPITPQVGSNASGTGDTQNPDVPNRNPGFQEKVILGKDGFRKTGRYFDPRAFSIPLAGTFGNVARGAFIGPGSINVDTSLFKRIPLNERWSLQLRAEAFNLFNHVNFKTPNPAVFAGNDYSPSAGIIEEAATSRQVQFALKLQF